MLPTISPETALVITLALVFYTWTFLNSGQARKLGGVVAPAVTGDPRFERAYRIQVNTIEQLVIFLPSIVLFDKYINPIAAAVLGLIWIVGRIIYARAYMNDPTGRGLGFGLTFIPNMILLLGALIGSARAFLIIY